MIQITKIQLFALIMIFEIGSTTLFALGIGAKQDTWIVILISSMVGFILLLVYTQIPKYFPGQHFGDILNKALGKKIGKPLLCLFGFYFIEGATHNFYEFGVLINMTALPSTPLLAILFIFIFAIFYILHLGFEVFARICEILLPIFLIFLILIYFFALFSGEFDFSALQPVLGNGFRPIIEESYTVIAFPFGEMVVFLMFWHYVKEHQVIRKTAVLAVGFSSLLLTLSLIVIISVLGPELAANAEIPLLETILSINIGDILTNLDSIAVLIMFIGGFFKTTLHIYGFVLAMTWLFNTNKSQWIMYITCLCLPFFVIHRFSGLVQQRWKGDFRILEIHVISFLPVLLLLIIVLLNKKENKSKSKKRPPKELSNQ